MKNYKALILLVFLLANSCSKEEEINQLNETIVSLQNDIAQLNFQINDFSSQVNDGLDWNFEAPDKMIITEGVKYDVTFKAQNNSSMPNTGTSIFNVLPPKIGPYLLKIECFCFQDQEIQPGEVVEFPVTFYIDPLILEDPEAKKVKNVTLSYTFFEKKE